MKILKLIMRNINSLYGTWEIDFTAPEYAAGLFAITGSTGSGKSTILDAMSLALFAETPRIGHGSNTEVVSRGTADCLAELTFESGGDLYMASFSFGSYRRGPRKGQLNESYLHKLAKNGVEIADKTSAVRKAMEEVTGLDKDRFTRTVMLAQGKFDAFLNAGDAKAAILEQITGTEIYSRISAMVRQIATSQTAELERLRAAACGIQPLTAEEEQQKQNELAALDIELTEKKKEYAFALAQMNLRENLEKLNTARMKNNAGQESLQQEKSVFAPLAIRLSECRNSEPVRHLYLELNELRRKNRQLLTELEQLEQAMPELGKNAETAKTLSAQATGKLETLKKNQAALQETTNKVRLLDAALADGMKQIRRIHSTMEREQTQIANGENARLRAESGLADLNEKRKVSESYCSTHSGDAILPEKAAEWNSALQYILERRAAALLTGKEKDRAIRELEHAQTAVAAALQTLKDAEDAIRQPAMEVDTLRQQISASETRQSLNEKQDILQRNLRAIQMIMDHAEARKHLQPGTPCPLCGATEHPYADPDVIPVQDQNEKDLDEIRQKLTALDRLEQQLRNAENTLHAAENKVQQAQNNREIAEQKRNYTEQVRDEKIFRYEEEIRNGKAKWEELKNALSAYGFELAERAAALPDTVAERIRAYREAEKSLQDFEQDQTRLQSEHAFAVQGKTDAENRLKDAKKEQNDLLVIQKQKKQERTDLFGDQDPDREWEKCLHSVQAAETEQHTAH
ncbi:MAG: AAA family ATPase, partial [Lentisphaeria bacterium]|nr:AAA family ATPase [Lentisphaeria bacterium]